MNKFVIGGFLAMSAGALALSFVGLIGWILVLAGFAASVYGLVKKTW